MAKQRFLDVVLRASNRRLKSDLRSSQRELKAFATRARDLLRSGFAAGVGGFAGFASAQGVMQFGKQVLDNEEALTRLGIQANMSAEELAKVRDVAAQTGREFGLGTAKVIEAASALIDLEGASGFTTEKMRVLAQASVATGADLKDLAGVGFALRNAFKTADADQLSEALSAVAAAGKQGSIPLSEMSQVLQQQAVTFAKFGSAGKAGAADLAAALQVARKGFGGASEAGTGLQALVAQLQQSSLQLASFGVRVSEIGKDGKERLRPLREILDDIAKKGILDRFRKKNLTFGSVEAQKFLEVLMENRQEFEALSESARNASDIQADSQEFLASTAGRLKVAIANAKGELEALFTPERLERFVHLVENGLVPALDFVLEHAKTIGILIAGWKIAEAGRSVVGFTAALAQGVTKAGGLMAVMGKIGLSGGGLLRSVVGFAGPIGVATTAALALAAAFATSLDKNERITAEQLRQAEITGKIAGDISQFDTRGLAGQKRRRASQLREDVKASNEAVFAGDFEKRARRAAGAMNMSLGETDELLALQQEFVRERGVVDRGKSARLGELLKRSGLITGDFLGGEAAHEAEAEAARRDIEAAAIKAVEEERFGRRDFSPLGLDLRKLATDKGITDEAQFRVFQEEALRELGRERSDLGPRLRLDHVRLDQGLALENGRLALDESGRVVRETAEPSSPLGRLFDIADAATRSLGDPALAEAITARLDLLIANLEAVASRPISVQLDGHELITATSNHPSQRRAPR